MRRPRAFVGPGASDVPTGQGARPSPSRHPEGHNCPKPWATARDVRLYPPVRVGPIMVLRRTPPQGPEARYDNRKAPEVSPCGQ